MKSKKKQSQVLVLPPVAMPQVRSPIGVVRCVLEAGRSVEVSQITEVRVSARRKEKAYRLDSGESIVVTSRKRLDPPAGVDGVLRVTPESDSTWLWHRGIEEFQNEVDEHGWASVRNRISDSWRGAFHFRAEARNDQGDIVRPGLRPPQIGALHAIGAHWSLHKRVATVVMPTGTGKTETMLGTLVAYEAGTHLVVVPSRTLRDQTARKYLTLGLLRTLGNLEGPARNPIVGILTKRPTTEADLEIFEHCNVVVATISSVAQGTAEALLPEIAARVDTLIVDEAHHVAARTWTQCREQFSERRVLQFTATPFRRDGKLVDGKAIYSYPLRAAQEDGYFTRIAFRGVYEIDRDESDRAIALAAVEKLHADIDAGLDHLLLARCRSIARAQEAHRLYEELAPEYSPVLVHSESDESASALEQLKRGDSRIVVCVDMLGEGFDLPQLKIAAIHDTHKSMAVLLQFTGRFTRTAATAIGEATVFANIANHDVSYALERLYSEDADWNHLLSEFSSEAVRQHHALVEFLNSSVRLDEVEEGEADKISHHLLRPKFSTAVYRAPEFHPKRFFKGLSKYAEVHQVWLHQESGTLYFVTRAEPSVAWSRSRELTDRQWDLFVLHHDPEPELLYVHSSDKSSLHEKLAKAVGGTDLIRGDVVFRTLGNINRLRLHNVGVRKYGRRNLGYALYTGADVAEALSITEKTGSVKSNLFGTGWEDGSPVNVGCSLKGRVWSREQGTVPEFTQWCRKLGPKLLDASIDTAAIIDNVLIPEEVGELPNARVLSVDWPVELLRQPEDRVLIKWGDPEEPLSLVGIERDESADSQSVLGFRVSSQSVESTYTLLVGGSRGFEVRHVGGPDLTIRSGKLEMALHEYLSDYPPLVRFLDLSELDGNLLVRPKDLRELTFPDARFEVWDWSGIDTSRESIWKSDQRRTDSIQGRVAEHFGTGGFEVVFDDDAPGESADLVCLREDDDLLRLALVHCKFSSGEEPGQRVRDVQEVCAQAVRSSKWIWRFKELCRHVASRERRLSRPYRSSRFLVGGPSDLNRYIRASRFKDVRAEIVIAQPGLSRGGHSGEQAAVLAAAYSFLKETVGVDLDVICSA